MKTNFTPIIVGVAQYTQSKETSSPLDPIGLMGVACEQAIKDTGNEKIRERIDTLRVVNIFCHSYEDAPGALAQHIRIDPNNSYYSAIGGNTPQLYVNKAAMDIAAGRSQVTLISGAEAFYAVRRGKKGDVSLNWPPFCSPKSLDGETKSGVSDTELRYDMLAPVYAYALIENRLRHVAGRSIETHRKMMGRTLERIAERASKNPYSWSKEALKADEITLPSPSNRMAGFPYTVRMSANLNVDQSAAIILTSEETALELGIPRDKWIYPMGGATFHNVWNIATRPDLHTSPALRHAGEKALEQAGLSISEIDAFDFYNCFSCAVELARNELGVSAEDQRPITLTGGLAYFGGPGNNYSLHAIANAVQYLRTSDKKSALVTALGWLNTKWSAGVYGKGPGKTPWFERDDSAIQERINSAAFPEPIVEADGVLTIESYTVVHGKDGEPHHATILGNLENGRRAFAFMFEPKEALARIETESPIGKKGKVAYQKEFGFNTITLEA